MENSGDREKLTAEEEQMVIDNARMLIREAMKLVPLEIPEAEKGNYEKLMFQIMMENKSPREAMGFSDEMIEHTYAYGFRLYNNGSYKKASEIFQSLSIFSPEDARFYLGQAACFQRLKEWKKAIDFYNSCSLLDTLSPMPFFYMYECYNQLKQKEDAALCLKATLARCGNNELFENIKERCQLLLNGLASEKKK